MAGDEHVNFTARSGGGGDGVEGRALDGFVVVFGNNECSHVPSFCLVISPSGRDAPFIKSLRSPLLGPRRGHLVALGEGAIHQITLASFFSFATSVATSGTLMPALRLGGSLTFSVLMRELTSTPRSAGLITSSVFFFAFMMLGSVT